MDETKDTQAKEQVAEEPKVEETLQQRLLGALQDMEQPKKDTEGYGYSYAALDQVVGIVTKACKAHGLMWRQGVVMDKEAGFLLVTSVFDGESEAQLDIRPWPRLTKPQEQGSAETYLRRYALLTAFGLAPADDDGAAASTQSAEDASRAAEIEREERSARAPRKQLTLDETVALTAEHLGVNADAVREEVQNRAQGQAFETIPESVVRDTLRAIWGQGVTIKEEL